MSFYGFNVSYGNECFKSLAFGNTAAEFLLLLAETVMSFLQLLTDKLADRYFLLLLNKIISLYLHHIVFGGRRAI